jgi:hypothetical protein
LTSADIGYQIRVQYTGTGNYTGTVYSTYTDTVSKIPVGGLSTYTPVLPSTTTTAGYFPGIYVSLFLLIIKPLFEISPQTLHTQKPHNYAGLPVGYFVCVLYEYLLMFFC